MPDAPTSPVAGDDHPVASAIGVPGAADAVLLPPPPSPADAVGTEAPPVTHRRALLSLYTLAAAAFLFVTNEASPLGVISVIAADLGRSESQIGLLTTAFALVVMVASIPIAILTKRLPRREVILVAIGVLTLGLVVVATAHSFEQLVAGRAVTALAHAGFWAVVTPAAAGMFPMAVRGRSVSRLLLGPSTVGFIGLPAVTWLALSQGWRAPYWALAVAALVLAVVVFVVMPSFRAEQGTVARGEFPSRRIFTRTLVVAGVAVAAMGTTWTYVTPFATEIGGFAPESVPVLLLVGGVAGLISMILVGRYLDRFPVKAVALGLATCVALWASLGLLGSLAAVVVIAVVMQGFAWSLLVASLINWAIRHAPGSTDIANATYATVFNGGNALGSVIGAAILAAVGAGWLPAASLVLTLVAAVVVWSVRGRRA